MKTSSDSNEVAIAEINSLRKRLADREEEIKQDKINTQRAHDQALKDMRDRHQAELNSLSSGKQSIADDLAAKEKQYLAELNAQKQSYEAKIDGLLKAHKKQLEELSGQQSEQAERLKGSISGLESQLQAVTEQAESDKAGLRNEATKLDIKAKALQVSPHGILKRTICEMNTCCGNTERAGFEKIGERASRSCYNWTQKPDRKLARRVASIAKGFP